jgi:UDP-N-acetyl-D-mannosaminuronic acid transferase (WecB/TagA/CpsF family)
MSFSWCCGPLFLADEFAEVVFRISASGIAVGFTAVTHPNKNAGYTRTVNSLPGVVMIGVDAAVDFRARRMRQAPNGQRVRWERFVRLTAELAGLRRSLLMISRFRPL